MFLRVKVCLCVGLVMGTLGGVLAAPDPGLGQEGTDWKNWGQPAQLQLLDLGDYRQSLQLSAAYQAYVHEAGLDPRAADLWAAESALLSGQFQVANTRRQQMVEWSRSSPNPNDYAFLQALLLYAAQRSGQPARAQELESTLEAAMQGLAPEQQSLYRFLLETQRARSLFRADAKPNWSQISKTHRAAFAALARFRPGPYGNQLWVEALSFWMNFWTWAQYDESAPEEAVDFSNQASDELSRLAGLETDQGRYQGHFGMMAIHLNLLHNRFRQGDLPSKAGAMAHLIETSQSANRAFLEQEQSRLESTLPPSIRKRLGESFRLQLLAGEWSFVQSQLVALELLLQPADQDPAPRLQELDQRAEATNSERGYVGLLDARWIAIDWLMEKHPPGWRQHADREIDSMLATCQRSNHRPGLLWAWISRGKLDRSVEALKTAITLLEEYVNDMGAAAGVRESYAQTYQDLVELLLEKGRNQEAMEVLARRSNLQSVQLGSQALDSKNSLARLGQQRQALEQQLALERSRGQGTEPTQQLLADTRAEFAQVLDKIRASHPNFDSVLSIRPVNLAVWQKSIPANATLVQYFPSDQGLFVFVATSQQLKIHRVAVQSQELARSARHLQSLLAHYPSQPSSRAWMEESKRLYDWLIRPLEADLGKRPVLAIIPSGALHYVPFPALIRGGHGKRLEYLVQSRQCVNLVKAADLSLLVQPPARSQGKGGLLVLANPDGTLPGAEREAYQVARVFASPEVRVGAQARLQPIPEGTRYLHMATHGFLLPEEPNKSYLVVAGKGEAGKLRIGEIYPLALAGVRLVGLSACQTALPEESTGAEVVSLAQAFSTAGGRAVLASLWSVSDDATQKLMVAFYGNLVHQQSLAESLQKAQLSLLSHPEMSHPFFWAAFPLFGDWR